jgi:hypothetical protein
MLTGGSSEIIGSLTGSFPLHSLMIPEGGQAEDDIERRRTR